MLRAAALRVSVRSYYSMFKLPFRTAMVNSTYFWITFIYRERKSERRGGGSEVEQHWFELEVGRRNWSSVQIFISISYL